jgi:hypothetical protein
MPRAQNSECSRRWGEFALGLLLLAGLFITRPCPAQSSIKAPPETVEIVLVGAVGALPAFSGRVTSWFDSEQFAVTVRMVARLDPARILSPEPHDGVSAWVLLRDPNHARFYFASASGPNQQTSYLVRELELEQGLDEVAAEHIAQVLYLSIVALLDGQAATDREEMNRVLCEEPTAEPSAEPSASAAQPRQEPTHEPKPTPPKPQARAGIESELTLGYGASLRGDEGLWHGPRVGLGVRVADGWRLDVLGQGALPSRREVDVVELEFYGGFGRLSGGYRHVFSQNVALQWGVGPGLELVHYRPERSLDANVTVGGGETELRPSLFAEVSGVFASSSPRIAVTIECMVSLSDTHYDVVMGDSRRVLGRSAPVVPLLGLETRW